MAQAKDQIYATVSSKGQLVIPAGIREKLGNTPGTRVAIRVEGPELDLKPETLAAKLVIIDKMQGITKTLKRIDGGTQSGTEMLIEDRRRERELPQQQRPTVARYLASAKCRFHAARKTRCKRERFLTTLCHKKGRPFLGHNYVSTTQ